MSRDEFVTVEDTQREMEALSEEPWPKLEEARESHQHTRPEPTTVPVPAEPNGKVVKWEDSNGREVEVTTGAIKQLFNCPNATDFELWSFMQLCKMQKLNPLLREVHLIKYGNNPAQIVVGKDAFTQRAEQHAAYDGFEAGIIVIPSEGDGQPIHLTGSFSDPHDVIVGGWCRVYRKDRKVPVEKRVSLKEYAQFKSDGTPNRFWREKPGTMIEKVAISQAHRDAFPSTFAALYGSEEMGLE